MSTQRYPITNIVQCSHSDIISRTDNLREILPTHRLQTRPSMARPRTPPGSSTVPGQICLVFDNIIFLIGTSEDSMFLIPLIVFISKRFLTGTLDTLGQPGRATMGSGATQAPATHHRPRRPFRKAGFEMRQDVFLKKRVFENLPFSSFFSV